MSSDGSSSYSASSSGSNGSMSAGSRILNSRNQNLSAGIGFSFNQHISPSPASYSNYGPGHSLIPGGPNNFLPHLSSQYSSNPFTSSNKSLPSGQSIADSASVGQDDSYRNTTIHYTIPSAAKRNATDNAVYMGEPLFALDAAETISHGHSAEACTIFTLSALNRALCTSVMQADERNTSAFDADVEGLRRLQTHTGNSTDREIRDVENFVKRISYVGVNYADNTVSDENWALYEQAKVHLLTVRLSGRMQMYNIWRDVGNGSDVGFLVRKIGTVHHNQYLKVVPIANQGPAGYYITGVNSVLNVFALAKGNLDRYDTGNNDENNIRVRKRYRRGRHTVSSSLLRIAGENFVDYTSECEGTNIVTSHMINSPAKFKAKFCRETGTIFEALAGPQNYADDNVDQNLYDPENHTASFLDTVYSEYKNADGQSIQREIVTIKHGRYIRVGTVERSAVGTIPGQESIQHVVSHPNAGLYQRAQTGCSDIYVHLDV